MPHKNKTRSRSYHAEYMRSYRRKNPREYDAKARARLAALRAAETPEKRLQRLQRSQAKRKKQYQDDETYRSQVIAAQKRSQRRLRAAILAGYGGKCVCCGEAEAMFLELDHVHGGGAKEFKAAKSASTLYRRVIARGFPDTYRILCANCNKGRYRNGGTCPHNRGI